MDNRGLMGFGVLAAMVAGLAGTYSPARAAMAAIVGTGAGQVAVDCATKAVGQEASPSVQFGGATTPQLVIPQIQIPSTTVGGVTVGPVTVPPQTVGGGSIGPYTVGPITIPPADQPNLSVVGGGTACDAVNVTAPWAAVAVSGLICQQAFGQELPSSGAPTFVPVTGVMCTPLANAPGSETVSNPCPSPGPGPLGSADPTINVCQDHTFLLPSAVATGATLASYGALPRPGEVAPDGGTYTGLAQGYVGVQVTVNGQPAGTGVGCATGDFDCDHSAVFATP